MKVREFFELLRKYPDWDVDIILENKDKQIFEDITDITCDDRNGNLIIVKKED